MFFLLLEVGADTYDTFLQNEKSRAKGEADNIDVHGKVAIAKKVVAQVEAMQEQSKHWASPLDYGEKLAEFKALMLEWDAAFRGLSNVRDQIHRVIADSKAALSGEKKTYHEQKQKNITFIAAQGSGISKNLASVFGELCYYKAFPPEKAGVTRVWGMDELWAQGDSDPAEVFGEPRFITAIPPGSEPPEGVVATHYHTAISDFLHAHSKVLDQRWRAQKPKVVEKAKIGAMVGTMDVTSKPFEWNSTTVGQTAWFDPVTDAPLLVASKRVLYCDPRVVSNPIRGHPMFFLNGTKDICMLLVSPTLHIANPDLRLWLQQCELKELTNLPAAILKPKDAAWIPTGWVPMWVPLPSDVNLYSKRPRLSARGKPAQDKKKDEPPLWDDSGGVSFLVCYQNSKVGDIDAALRTQLASDLAASKALMPKGLLQVVGAKKWFDSVPIKADGKEDLA